MSQQAKDGTSQSYARLDGEIARRTSMTYQLVENLFAKDVAAEPIRAGFGRGLKAAGEADERVVDRPVPACTDG